MNLRYQIFMWVNGNLRLDSQTNDRDMAHERYEQLHRLYPGSEIKFHDRLLVVTAIAKPVEFVATTSARAA